MKPDNSPQAIKNRSLAVRNRAVQKVMGQNVSNRIVKSMAERAASGNVKFAGKTDKLIANYRKALQVQKKFR